MAKQGLPNGRAPFPGELERIFNLDPIPQVDTAELEKKVDALNESIKELSRQLQHIFGGHVVLDGQLVDMGSAMRKAHGTPGIKPNS